MHIQHRFLLSVLAAVVFAWTDIAGVLGAESPSLPTQQTVSAWLRHQEGLVRSMECEYETISSPTPADRIPLIREICRKRGSEKDYLRYIYTADDARLRTTLTRWWSKGPKERTEVFPLPRTTAASPASVTAFDGLIVRSIGRDRGNHILGNVETIKGAHWDVWNRVTPFSLLFEHAQTPYSDIVSKGSDFRVTAIVREGKTCTRVSIHHPTSWNCAFVLLFDDAHRLIERDIISQLPPLDPEPRISERHAFTDYEVFPDQSGEKIWFPRKAVYTDYVGTLPDGRLVDYNSETINVLSIHFNVDIPNSRFLLDMPGDIPIYDGVNKLGWVGAPTPEPPTEGRGRVPWWLVLVGIGLAALLGIILTTRRLRKKRASVSTSLAGPRPAGFALVELLAVAVFVALLLALFVAAIRQSRGTGDGAAPADNLRAAWLAPPPPTVRHDIMSWKSRRSLALLTAAALQGFAPPAPAGGWAGIVPPVLSRL